MVAAVASASSVKTFLTVVPLLDGPFKGASRAHRAFLCAPPSSLPLETLALSRARDTARAMSQENVEVVRRNLEAAAVAGMRLDGLDDQARDRYMQAFHPEVEFREDPKFPEGVV